MLVEEKVGDMVVGMVVGIAVEEKVGDVVVDTAVEGMVDDMVVDVVVEGKVDGIVAVVSAGTAVEEVSVVHDDKASRAVRGFRGGILDVGIVPLPGLSSAEEVWGMDGMLAEEVTAVRDGKASRAARMFRGGIRTCFLYVDIAPPSSVAAGLGDRADIAEALPSLD